MKKKILAAILGASIFTFAPSFYQTEICEAAVMQNYDLNFDSSIGVEKVLNCEGRQIKFVAYENIVYVKNPANVERQSLSIFIPAEYFSGGTINGYTASTAPIFMPNSVGGYMAGNISSPSSSNSAGQALAKGLVVVSPALRGRNVDNGTGLTLDSDGTGSFYDFIADVLADSAEDALAEGTSISESWITIDDNGDVTDVDLSVYGSNRDKSQIPAFDRMD